MRRVRRVGQVNVEEANRLVLEGEGIVELAIARAVGAAAHVAAVAVVEVAGVVGVEIFSGIQDEKGGEDILCSSNFCNKI